jgi:hypothetical protein
MRENKLSEKDLIIKEKESICELCGKKAETRPYGPKGERVCFECGMQNPGECARAVSSELVQRYQKCALRIFELFDTDPLPSKCKAHFYIERLEAILDAGLLKVNLSNAVELGLDN